MANTKTQGTVTIGGVGYSGLNVKVFDQDYAAGVPTVSKHLGSDYTDSSGDYSVSYEASEYGSWPGDRVKIADGSWVPPTLPKYGPGKPDLYVEVWDGDLKLKTSSVHKNVTSTTKTINVNLPADPEPERSWWEKAGDACVDFFVDVAEVAAEFFEDTFDTAATVTESIFGEKAAEFVASIGKKLGETSVGFANRIRDFWENVSNRAVPIPDDLWEACRERYRNYKRDILLRHFLPPDRTDERFRFERAIPYLVSGQNYMGRVQSNAAAKCELESRYHDDELYPLSKLARPNDPPGPWTNEEWITYIRRNADVYARTYENGLAGTGSLIACLAFEYALAGSDDSSTNATPSDYRQECEDLIMLALDAIEDLDQRTGNMPGYIIRYYEDGDCIEYQAEDDELCRVDATGLVWELDAGEIPQTLADAIANCGTGESVSANARVLRPCEPNARYILVGGENIYIVDHADNELVISRGKSVSCGFPDDGSYCEPITGPTPDDDGKAKEEERRRKYEPSGDEYVHLLEGLSAAFFLLPPSSPVHSRIQSLLGNIRTYLEGGYYFLRRPCGNFTHRGCYTSVYAYPISCFLQSAIGVAPENAGPVSKESILNAAQLTAEDEINISAHDANSMWAVLNVLALLPPRLRLKMWSIAALVSQLEVPPALTRVSTDIEVLNELLRLEDDIDSVTEAWDMWDKLPEDDEGNKYLETALLPVWALAIFSKSCLLGRGGDESTQDSLKSIFKTWFDVVGDRQFRAQRDERGYSYNPVTLATAIALPGRRTHAVWAKLRTFFDEQDGCKELVETEGQGDDVETMYFPLTHLLIELDHEGTGKPRASANEKAGEDMVMQAMWPIAIIGRALGKPLDASIADFIEEADMPNRDEIHRRVQIALAARSH